MASEQEYEILSGYPEGTAQFVNVAAEPPCTLDVQVAHEHELEFHFDETGHVTEVRCSCGKRGRVEML